MRPAPTSKKIMCKRPQGLIVCCFSRRVVSYGVYNRESEYGYNQMKIHWRIQSKGLGGWHSLKLHSPKEWCTWSGHVYIYTVFFPVFFYTYFHLILTGFAGLGLESGRFRAPGSFSSPAAQWDSFSQLHAPTWSQPKSVHRYINQWPCTFMNCSFNFALA